MGWIILFVAKTWVYQAYVFAGNMLVPKIALIQKIEKGLGKVPEKKFLPEEIFPISQELLDIFKVSGEVLSRKLGKEGIIRTDGPPLVFNLIYSNNFLLCEAIEFIN